MVVSSSPGGLDLIKTYIQTMFSVARPDSEKVIKQAYLTHCLGLETLN